jgi:hypothetical protein
MQIRCDIVSEAAQKALQGDFSVTVEQPGPFELKLSIGSTLQQSLHRRLQTLRLQLWKQCLSQEVSGEHQAVQSRR